MMIENPFLTHGYAGASYFRQFRQRSIKALTDREMVAYDQEKYFVYDVFLSRWLELLP